jgi:ribosomal-protein-alanine N-acetyltransferase
MSTSSPPQGIVLIRAAAREDLPGIVALERRSFPDPWSVGSFRFALMDDARFVLVAEVGGKLVGYAVGVAAADEAELSNIAVLDSARRSGVGRALLSAVIREAMNRRAARLYLEVRASNAAARALYSSAGFDETGRRRGYYSRPAEDAIMMMKELAG